MKKQEMLEKYLLDFKIDTNSGFDSSHTLPLKSDESFSSRKSLKNSDQSSKLADLSNKDLDFIIGK